MASHRRLLKLWVPLRATATTTPMPFLRCIVPSTESARAALSRGDSGASWDAQEVPLTQLDAAVAEVQEKGALLAFLLEPTPIDDMARVAFAGGVMPQKSTDFYPKLLTGVTIYRL